MPAFQTLGTVVTGQTVAPSHPNLLFDNTLHLYDRAQAMDGTVAALDTRIDALEAVSSPSTYDEYSSTTPTATIPTSTSGAYGAVTLGITGPFAITISADLEVEGSASVSQWGLATLYLNGSPVSNAFCQLAHGATGAGNASLTIQANVTNFHYASFTSGDVLDIRLKANSASSTAKCYNLKILAEYRG